MEGSDFSKWKGFGRLKWKQISRPTVATVQLTLTLEIGATVQPIQHPNL